MNDGHSVSLAANALPQGYDIGPDEDRYDPTQFTPVDVVTDSDDHYYYNSGVSRMFIRTRADGLFDEPLDETRDIVITESGQAGRYSAEHRFYHESNRLKTFNNQWQESYYVNPSDLARNGFIYYGPGDKVKCVFCLRTLWHWEPGDSVEHEHRRNYPNCPFVQGLCEDLNVPLNVSENIELLGLHMKNEQPVQASVPAMQNYSERIRTFQTWPDNVPVRADALAEAGLFYLGTTDKVKCFSCGKVLCRWEPGDDPWLEHVKWSRSCPYVLSMKGSEFVEAALQPARVVQPSSPSSATAAAVGVDEDLRNPAVQAMMHTYDITLEQMRQKLEEIKLTRGPEHKVTRDDLKDFIQ